LVTRTIEGPEDAIALVRSLSENGEIDFSELNFGPGFSLNIRLPRGFDSEIPASYIDSYFRHQQQLFRVVALVENGNSDIKTLTSAQLEKYEFKVKVSKGSSEFSDNTPGLIARLGVEAIGKMDGTQALIALLGLAAIVATGWGVLAYIQSRKETRLEELATGERRKMLETFEATTAKNADTYRDIVKERLKNLPFAV